MHVCTTRVVYGGIPYEEEDTCMYVRLVYGGIPYEEEDTCMYVRLESYMEACHMRRRIHAYMRVSSSSYGMPPYTSRTYMHVCTTRVWRHTI
jgi:hypothetical protein